MRCPICDWPHGAEEPDDWKPDGGLLTNLDGTITPFCLNCAALLTHSINEALFAASGNVELAAGHPIAVVIDGAMLDAINRESP